MHGPTPAGDAPQVHGHDRLAVAIEPNRARRAVEGKCSQCGAQAVLACAHFAAGAFERSRHRFRRQVVGQYELRVDKAGLEPWEGALVRPEVVPPLRALGCERDIEAEDHAAEIDPTGRRRAGQSGAEAFQPAGQGEAEAIQHEPSGQPAHVPRVGQQELGGTEEGRDHRDAVDFAGQPGGQGAVRRRHPGKHLPRDHAATQGAELGDEAGDGFPAVREVVEDEGGTPPTEIAPGVGGQARGLLRAVGHEAEQVGPRPAQRRVPGG
jgi:hypothetical protein